LLKTSFTRVLVISDLILRIYLSSCIIVISKLLKYSKNLVAFSL